MEPRLEVADVFRQYEQEFLARWGDTLSSHQRKAFRDICACRTAALGARLQQCDHCSHQDVVFQSCRNRACPKCQSGAREKWLATTAQELLPAPYSHVTFTLPHQLCGLALQNPRLVYGMLFQAASQTLLTLAADPRRIGAQIGFLAVLHTWDQQMRPHPHLHCLVPAGGIAPDHSRWIRTRHPRFFLPGKVLAKMFRSKFLVLLSRAYRRNKLRLCGVLAAFKKPTAFDRLFRQLKRLDWVVDAKAPFGNPEHVLKYLARYTHRVAISNGRLLEMHDGHVTFRWRDSANGNQQKLLTLDAIEFIRRFLLHILPPGFVKIRHFGFLAHPHRRSALLLCRKLLRAPASPNPLTDVSQKPVEHRCPRCGIGTLCFLGWIPAGAVSDLPVFLPVFVDSS
jgi:Putative transposase/Transposase zinc-binding domain